MESNLHTSLQLVGYDDIFISDFLTPPLTSIEQPVQSLAQEAVNQVLQAIEGEGGSKNIFTFDPVLKVRGSTKAFNPR